MVDVHMNERYVIESLLSPQDISVLAQNIVDLPVTNKAVLFRNLDTKQVTQVLENLRNVMAGIRGDTDFAHNRNNQIGRDATGVQSNHEFEIKIGSPTHAALGIRTMRFFLRPEIVDALPNRAGINRRKALMASILSDTSLHTVTRISQAEAEAQADLRQELVGTLSAVQASSDPFAAEERRALNLLVSGATQSRSLLAGLRRGEGTVEPHTVIQLTKNRGELPSWNISEIPSLARDQDWKLNAVLTNLGRFSLYFKTEGATVKLTHNQKNSCKFMVDGEQVRFGYPTGTNTFSFNAWVL